MTDDDEEWEMVGLLPDCAHATLGAPALVEGESSWFEEALPLLWLQPDGTGVLCAYAGCDGLPVEVQRIGGVVRAVRLEFVDDVLVVEEAGDGEWVTIGRMCVGATGVVAWDVKMAHDPDWRVSVDLPTGWYAAQVFETEDDCLGIRLVAE